MRLIVGSLGRHNFYAKSTTVIRLEIPLLREVQKYFQTVAASGKHSGISRYSSAVKSGSNRFKDRICRFLEVSFQVRLAIDEDTQYLRKAAQFRPNSKVSSAEAPSMCRSRRPKKQAYSIRHTGYLHLAPDGKAPVTIE